MSHSLKTEQREAPESLQEFIAARHAITDYWAAGTEPQLTMLSSGRG